jgi:heme-degrading monooxygenase HmoA
MQIAVIDQFRMPATSRDEFLATVDRIKDFLQQQEGFLEGAVYQNQSPENGHEYVTVVIWENRVAFDKARAAAAGELPRLGIDPGILERLHVEARRAVYDRYPF